MMEQLGQQVHKFKYSKSYFGRSRKTSAALAFGGQITPTTAATEEWTGAGSPLTKTITVS
jgi:hypothetical protein